MSQAIDGVPSYRLWGTGRSDWCDYDVSGVKHYKREILGLLPDNWNRDGHFIMRDVELVHEPSNPFDRNAVAIVADDAVIGHLEWKDAPLWLPVVQRTNRAGHRAVTLARIWVREYAGLAESDDDYDDPVETVEHYVTVKLKLESPDHALPVNEPPSEPYTFLPRAGIVQVGKDDDHFESLRLFVPPSGQGVLYATLHRESATNSKGTVRDFIEVRVDDKPVGELSAPMSKRFFPMVDHLKDRGLVAACWAQITGSAVAAKIKIDAVKANEVSDSLLEGPPLVMPSLREVEAFWPPTAAPLNWAELWPVAAWRKVNS
jgi:hypothetical protein